MLQQAYTKQKGLTTVGWVVCICFFALAMKLAFAMAPAYFENRYIQEALQQLAEKNSDVAELTKSEIRKQLDNFLSVNSVRGRGASSFKIKQKRDRTLITNNYEVREDLFLNISVVMRFENQLDSSNPEACCAYLVKNEEEKTSD